jgi:hypothetical protein
MLRQLVFRFGLWLCDRAMRPELREVLDCDLLPDDGELVV